MEKGGKMTSGQRQAVSKRMLGNKRVLGMHWKCSEKAKKNMSDAKIGKPGKNKGKHWKCIGIRAKFTEEHKKNLSKANKGKKHSEETKEKMRYRHLGKKYKPMSEIGKMNISKSHKGEKSYLWRGGISFEPYGLEFNKDLKEVIRNRDRRKCQICEKTELENNKKLDCHHIDYNKRNNNPNNLIAICRKCHLKTNHNRQNWINYFNN